MNLQFDPSLAEGYKSRSQIARVLTEAWFDENVYCPACSSNGMDRLPDNTKVADFVCPSCEEMYQLKSKSSAFGRTIINSEYYTKVKRIRSGRSPNWVFLRYSWEERRVEDLMMIPRHFMTLEAIQKRKPLGPNARRAGWTGSNILMDRLPQYSRLFMIQDGREIDHDYVRDHWKRFQFLGEKRLDTRGWLNDVLECVKRLGKEEFTLAEMYTYEDYLQKLHPDNQHVKPKIRQQLQMLRDHGIIEFLSRGEYRLLFES